MQGVRSIATGNWGCGAFGGNAQLKSMVQWAAASCAGTPMLHYYTFGNPDVQQVSLVVWFSVLVATGLCWARVGCCFKDFLKTKRVYAPNRLLSEMGTQSF